jgi:perosamine synthetase
MSNNMSHSPLAIKKLSNNVFPELSELSQTILEALQNMYASTSRPISLHEPYFNGQEQEYVSNCISTGWVSSVGNYVTRFEHTLAQQTGSKHVVATVNGTAALHLALKCVGIEPGDEVLVPALTFVATANAVSYCGAIPHFVDSDWKTLGVDPQKLRTYLEQVMHASGRNRLTGRPIKALIVVHTFGHAANLKALKAVCDDFHLDLIEDAAESLGSYSLTPNKIHTGLVGRVAALSFNGNKIITTGGGGALLTQDSDLAERAKHLSTTAKSPHPWAFWHDDIGYNYRLPNINAALGCAQLEQLTEFLRVKKDLANTYQATLDAIAPQLFFSPPDWSQSNHWLNTLILPSQNSHERESLIRLAHDRGIQLRPCWTLLSDLPAFDASPRMTLDTATDIVSRCISLPSGVALAKSINSRKMR